MMGSEKGSVLVIVITGITIIAAIGAGLAAMVSSGARTGANYSLSVQALYAAESGLEWAGSELRSYQENNEWVNFCASTGTEADPGLKGETRQIKQNVQAFFTIVDSKRYPEKGTAQGCEVTVSGWVGSYDNPLAKRQIIGKISAGFIESEGFVYDEEVKGLDSGGDIKKELNQGNLLIADSKADDNIEVEIKHEGNVVIENSEAGGDIEVEIKGKGQDNNKVFIKNTTSGEDIKIEIKHEGDVCFENIDTEEDIKIEIESDGNVCLKNVNVGGDIVVEIKRDGYVCIQGSITNDIEIKIERDGNVCVNNDTIADDIEIEIKRNGSSCIETNGDCSCTCSCQFCDGETGGGVIQNPVGTDEGSWSEG